MRSSARSRAPFLCFTMQEVQKPAGRSRTQEARAEITDSAARWPHAIEAVAALCDAQRFFALRAQAGQWGVAANFPNSAFALFSIASAVMAVGTLTGQPLGNAFLPNISSLVGESNFDGARK